MYLIPASGIIMASILFSLCASSMISYSINSAFALEIDAEVKASIGSENKTSSQDKASMEEKTDVSMKAESKNKSMMSSYQKIALDSKNSFVVNTKHHLYNPEDEVQIEGSIWSNLISQIGGVDSVKIQVVDNKGAIVYDDKVEVNSDGRYSASFVLPADSQNGAYTIKSSIDVSADLSDTLTIAAQSNLQTSSKFVVASSDVIVVKAEGRLFDVNIASNSKIDSFEFKQNQKMMTFTVEGESGTQGVTKITIPKAMLSGEMSVIIDGKIASSDDVIISSDTETESTLEINYHHSIHTIDITGTNVVPEFPESLIIVMAAGSVAAAVFSRMRISQIQKI
ncbi:MAG TPA: MG2 domain-containing protein [Nitrosopumilaceae archaeon]|nr:MG2 domain-containing protein [Nitrosopumilaceae archaeon]